MRERRESKIADNNTISLEFRDDDDTRRRRNITASVFEQLRKRREMAASKFAKERAASLFIDERASLLPVLIGRVAPFRQKKRNEKAQSQKKITILIDPSHSRALP